MPSKLTRTEAHALSRLAQLSDDNPPYEWWKTIFIGSHSASVMRRNLAPKSLVEIRKQNDGYRYRITEAGRRALSEDRT